MNEIDIRKKIDLHYGRNDFSANLNYVEFYFHCCFYELFNIGSAWESDLQGNEISELARFLGIKLDEELLMSVFKDQANHSVEVFHSEEDEQVFAYFDLEKDPTDQNDMFFLGISCRKEDESKIIEMLLNIYRKLKTSSPFTFDILNHTLYNRVFRSFFYFYDNNYNTYKRKMHHHNLKHSK